MNSVQKKKFRKILAVCLTVMVVMSLSIIICAAEDTDNTGGFGNVLEQFISILVGGLKSLGGGIGSGVNEYVSDLFLEIDASGNIVGLSMFGGVAAIFGGVALAVGLTTLIFNWIRSLGN